MNIDYSKITGFFIDELNKWVEILVRSTPNVILAVLIVLLTLLIAKAIRVLSTPVLSRTTENQAVKDLIKKCLYIGALAAGVFVALGVLNLDKTVTSLLAGAGVIGLALGFAFQEIATNFVSGVLIAIQTPYKIGDIVHAGDFLGTVQAIELRSTMIRTFDGQDVIVPNKKMYTEPLINFTLTPRRRLDIKVGVAYSSDLRAVEETACRAVEKIPGRIVSEDIGFFYEEFADSSINFTLQIWIDYPANNNYNRFRHLAIVAVKEAFDKKGISIPFPMRTLEIIKEPPN